MNQEKQVWAKKSTFIFAAAGSAIGLGNIWKFPYMVGENGGGAFVLVYLLCVLIIGLPLMMSESIVGKYSHGNAIDAIRATSKDSNASKFWMTIPIIGFVCMFLLLSFYSVIAGWALDYTYGFATGKFNGISAKDVGGIFDGLLASPTKMIIWHTVFTAATAFIIGKGATDGIEKALSVMMPLLVILLVAITLYSAFATDYFAAGVKFLFEPDFSKITLSVVINALGQAFFSLSLGMCAIMTYAAYMRDDVSITESSVWVVILDTAMALLAGLAIFPIVFANGLEASGGPGLLFVTLSTAFAKMSAGTILGFGFFFLVTLAAISSSISMVEPVVKWISEKFNTSRKSATYLYCFVVWVFGLLTVFSFSNGDTFIIFGKTPFDIIDYFTANILLPLGGLLLALYIGWVLNKEISKKQLFTLNGFIFSVWYFIVKFIAPVLILIILVSMVLGEEKVNQIISSIFG